LRDAYVLAWRCAKISCNHRCFVRGSDRVLPAKSRSLVPSSEATETGFLILLSPAHLGVTNLARLSFPLLARVHRLLWVPPLPSRIGPLWSFFSYRQGWSLGTFFSALNGYFLAGTDLSKFRVGSCRSDLPYAPPMPHIHFPKPDPPMVPPLTVSSVGGRS